MSPAFLYFDLGNVLLSFSNERACEQMAAVAGLKYDQVAQFVLGPHEQSSLLWRFEHGQVTEEEFFRSFCDEFDVSPDRQALDRAACDMFTPIDTSFSLVKHLCEAGYRLGILSNTNPIHWRYLTDGRFPLLNSHFDQHVTSFAAGSMKPARKIYDLAVQRAGVSAEQVFFVDDRIENVEGALAAGIDAVQYVSHEQLVRDLRARAIAV